MVPGLGTAVRSDGIWLRQLVGPDALASVQVTTDVTNLHAIWGALCDSL